MKKIITIPLENPLMNEHTGVMDAPDEILEELDEISCNESGNVIKYNSEKIEIDENYLEKSYSHIENKIKELRVDTEETIIIGGDHSITFPSIKGFASKYNNPGLIMLDAHPDCLDISFNTEQEERKDLIRGLVGNQIIKKQNIILIGTRRFKKEEIDFLKEHSIKYVTMKDINFGNLSDIIDLAMEKAMTWDATYVSLDIDVADPAVAPGTGSPEVGGFFSKELIFVMQRLKHLKNLKIVDIVEVNPRLDMNKMTVKLAAKIISELL